MADYPLLAVLATGNPGQVNTSNFGTIPKLKVSNTLDVTNNITVGGTVDGVDIATLNTNFGTHDDGTARAQHSAIGDHTHVSAGAEAGTIDHGALTGRTDDDHSGHPWLVGRSGGQILKGGIDSGDDLTLESTAHGTKGQVICLDEMSMSSKKIVSLLDPASAQDAATKTYVDTKVAEAASGIDPKGSVDAATTAALPACTAAGSKVGKTLTADAVGVLTVDGVTILLNDFVLVKNQVTGADNGRYKCTTEGTAGVAFVLTRAIDSDEDAEVTTGLYVYVEEGTVNGKSAWTLTTLDPITVDTTAWVMELFMTAGIIVAGTGASMTGSTLNVGGGDGIVANADDVAVDLATNPGLQFTSNKLDLKIEANKGLTKGASGIATVPNTAAGLEVGVSGLGVNLEASNPSLQVSATELGIKFNANGGLQKTASGTEIKIDDTPDTLDVDSSGIKVVGLPSLFKVNDVAVSANVTAANLNDLTDGTATTLHSHSLASHALAGASHSTDTLVNLNSKLTDLITTYGKVRDIGVGTDAQRPAFGAAGRFWWSTDSNKLYEDTGSAWDTIVATPSTHASTHQNGGGDEISVADLSGLLADDQNPVAHAADHKHGGGDEVATVTPAANAIPKANASNKLAAGWIQEVLAYADLTDDPITTHAALTTGVHGAGASTLATVADIATHAGAADPHTGYQKESEKGAASGYASLNGSTLVVQNPANATATPTASKIVIAEGDGKIDGGWIDPADITGADLSWAGKQNFNDEITVSTLLMDGAVIGPQISATIGSGGVTAGDTIKFDGTGQIVQRSANSDDANGIVTVGGAASATGWYCPFGIVEVTWDTAPTAYGEAVFLSQTSLSEMYWTTTVPTGAGKIYEGWAWGTGVSAKIFFSPRKAREIEA